MLIHYAHLRTRGKPRRRRFLSFLLTVESQPGHSGAQNPPLWRGGSQSSPCRAPGVPEPLRVQRAMGATAQREGTRGLPAQGEVTARPAPRHSSEAEAGGFGMRRGAGQSAPKYALELHWTWRGAGKVLRGQERDVGRRLSTLSWEDTGSWGSHLPTASAWLRSGPWPGAAPGHRWL